MHVFHDAQDKSNLKRSATGSSTNSPLMSETQSGKATIAAPHDTEVVEEKTQVPPPGSII